jgi:hypothetical protein
MDYTIGVSSLIFHIFLKHNEPKQRYLQISLKNIVVEEV